MPLTNWIKSLSVLITPHYCPICGIEWGGNSGWACEDCWKRLTPAGKGLWKENPKLRSRTFVVFHYDEIARQLVHQMKFAGREDIAYKLGSISALRFREWFEIPDFNAIVPVPLHPARVRERGYNQNLTLANGIASILDLPVRTDILIRTRHRPPQSRLSDARRKVNLRRAFALSPFIKSIPTGRILLVDDVIHTGATVIGCMDILELAGMDKVFVITSCG